ncbi:MAG: polysaccharide deacetylase family protein [Alphaproteobacteria bacterium]|nr:MAG: polysaccharide deacetylase family protein [Alphaproteobacteria bacterium]
MKRRDLILGSGAAIAGASILAPGAALSAGAIALPDDLATERLITVTAVKTRRRVVALTFDDGPHPVHTPQLLDMLKARRIRATFYVIGRNVARYPDIVKRMVDEGHEIGNHTWRHPFLSKLGKASVLRELDRTSEAIYKAVQRIPVTMRPPYGAMTRSQRQMVAAERDMPTILWSVDPEDWRRPGSDVVARRILSGAAPGAIILSHDIHGPTIRAMPATLDGLRAQGFRFQTVSMILGHRDWTKLRWRLPRVVAAKN